MLLALKTRQLQVSVFRTGAGLLKFSAMRNAWNTRLFKNLLKVELSKDGRQKWGKVRFSAIWPSVQRNKYEQR